MSAVADAGLLPGSLLLSVLGAAAALLLSILLGAALIRSRRQPPAPASHPDAAPEPEAEFLLDLATWLVTGIAASSFLWLLASAGGLLIPGRVLGLTALLVVVLLPLSGRRVLRAFSGLGRQVSGGWRRLGPTTRLAASLPLTAILIMLAGVAVLATISTVHYDDLVYHLGLPRQGLITGQWPGLPHFHHALMPASWETSYLVPLALGGGSGPQLLNAVLLALFAALALRLALRGAALLPAAVAVALLVSSRVLVSSGAQAGNDLFVGLALLAALSHALEDPGPRGAALAGACAGAAASAKFTGLLGAAIIGLVMITLIFRSGPGIALRLRSAGIMGLLVLVFAMPWSLRAGLATGNPVYPAFTSLLGGEGWDETAAEIHRRDASAGAMPTEGMLAFVRAPWVLLTDSGALGDPAGLNVLLAVLAAVGAWRARRDERARRLMLYLGLAFVAWCATSLMLRFAIAPLAVLAALAARAWPERAGEAGAPALRALLMPVVMAWIAVVAFGLASVRHLHAWGEGSTWALVLERERVLPSRIDLARMEPHVASLPHDAKVLVVGEARLALIPREAIISTAIDAFALSDLLASEAHPERSRELAALGVTHVIVNERELERFASGYGFFERIGPEGSARLRSWLGGLPEAAREGRVSLRALPLLTESSPSRD